MRLATFAPRASYPVVDRLGALLARGKIVDLASAYRSWLTSSGSCEKEAAVRLAEALLPGDMVMFLEGGRASMEAAERALEFARQLPSDESVGDGERPIYPLDSLFLFAPIRRPRSLRDFLCFEEHIRNVRERRGMPVPPEWYEIPVYYKGNPATIIGPDEPLVWPRFTEQLDYELEMACVIGRSGRNVSASEAERFIAGYMVMNDFSARDIQVKEMAVNLGPAKGKDFATALGPFLVTPDEVADPYDLRMTARVNGELWSDGSSRTIYRKFPEMIAHASMDEQLCAGDVLGSGTVGKGCGFELGRFLSVGDVVELEIESLGVLVNRVVGSRP